MGHEIAKLLAARDATISLADINGEALKRVTQALPGNNKHIYTVIDVTKSEEVNGWIERTVKELGKIDGAANMAGILAHPVPVTEHSDETWDRMFAVNTRGVFNCIRAELRAMGPGGSIVSCLT